MHFNKVSVKNMRLGDETKVSKTYTRQVEKNSRLTQFIENTHHYPKESFVDNKQCEIVQEQ